VSIFYKYKVESIKKDLCKEWLLKKHYAKRIPSISYSFGLYDLSNGVMIGCCTYGIPPQNNALLLCGEENKKHAIELNRLIKNDGLPKNTQSWFVAQTFKLLPKPMIILSYSDCNNGHNGYTYQALNFLYTGEGGSANEYFFRKRQYTQRHLNKEWIEKRGGKWCDDLTINENFLKLGGEIIPQKPKHRYVIFLGNKSQKKKFKKLLKWNILPYPKKKNTKYDTSYKTSSQLNMFL
tara:strand:+ start:9851 stop:10558 length:708 start_codon:yes stop_codon:yes gene_type:complete